MKNSWLQNNDKSWSYYDSDGNLVTEKWLEADDLWYYFDSNSKMVTGWFKDNSDNHWYYMHETTDSKSGTTKGSMAAGWIYNNNYWYYLAESSNSALGVYKGQLQTGWIYYSNTWYYAISTTDASKAEYLGQLVVNQTRTIDGQSYIFGEDGALQENSSSDSLVSDSCLYFVKGYEKFYSYKYDDGTGTITQGYGATNTEIEDWGVTITEEQAAEELKSVINSKYAKPIKEDLSNKGVSLTQNQLDALVSCAYNIGVSSLLGSSLYRYIVSGGRDAEIIVADFCMWNKCINEDTKEIEVSSGLNKRRIAEANIFNNNIYDSRH